MTSLRLLFATAVLTTFACGGPKPMTVDRKPIAEFKYTQSTVRPQVFGFDAAMSRPTVGTLAKYKWLFGDEASGAAPTSVTGPSTQHAYKAAGSYTVTLVVADDKDVDSDPVSEMVTVSTLNVDGPMAKIVGPSTGQPMAMLTFDGSTSTPSGDIESYSWDFGDSTSKVTGKDKSIVQHAFATAAIFRVTLTVTDSLGQNATAELQVAVGDNGPLAVCSWSPNTVSVGTNVMFNGSASTAPSGSMITAWLWDFGDGVNNQPGAMKTHAYAMTGTFKPKLTVYDNHSPTPRSHTANCADVVVAAASLCDGDYQWSGSGGSSLCNFSATTMQVHQMAGGTITMSETGPGGTPINYTGTWTATGFMLTGSYSSGGGDYDITITGSFNNGCMGWTGKYDTAISGIDLCSTNVTATKL